MRCSTLLRRFLRKTVWHRLKHSGVHALFGKHFAKPGRIDSRFHRFLLDAFDRRLQAGYGFEAVITSEEVNLMIDQAREFLAHAQDLLQL
jgi:uncharacterized protein (UPF0332 family)